MKVNNSMPPAIIVSGLTMALGVVRALGAEGVRTVVLHYDRRDTAHLSRWCTYHKWIPNPRTCEEAFIDALMAYAKQCRGAILFPSTDEAVVAVARNIEPLQRYFKVACSPWKIARLFIEKQCTYELAEKNGIPAPKTCLPTSLEELERYASRAQFPCLVKPCQGHLFYEKFHRKVVPVVNIGEAVAVYRQARDAGLDVMLQEIIPGNDTDVVNYNAYFHHGEPSVEFTAQHIRNAPPLWGSPRVVMSRDIPEVLESGRKILRAMSFTGYACTEFKRDARDGVYKLMEVNGRHNLSTLLAVRCGINFPWLHYRHLVFGELPSARAYREGIYWIDLTRDIAYSAKYVKVEKYRPAEYLRPYFHQHTFAILDFKDPLPFVKRCLFLCAEALRGLFRSMLKKHQRPDLLADRLNASKA
jgi:D-aspartate ligase